MFNLPPLPYSYDALEPYIDKETMHIHHEKHHAAYVKSLNEALSGRVNYLKMDITELIKSLAKIPQDIKIKVRNNGGGHFNHSFFWRIMIPNGSQPSAKFREKINEEFGSFEKFRQKFTQVALGRFGSGWAWLVVDKGRLEIMDTPNQDTPIADGKIPILGVDVWEHAYYLKYQNRRADYIAAWFNVVNWKEVEKKFLESQKI